MIPINEGDPARQAALALSERLGNRAATSPATRPRAAFPQPDVALPPRLAVVLSGLGRRAREHAADKFRANEFMAP
jgi:hypothetical protein